MAHYRMSDIVCEINERENSPSSSKYERFVGLEHYVSGEVEIRQFGSTDKLESAMKVFHSGDILVARRNVYLKRAATVNFDGLTSGDSIVLRANDSIIGRLLPFVLNTSDFWDFAEQNADGTMSKRLSPKTLLQYEFDLPDREDQEQFANTLWAAEETKYEYQNLLAKTDELVKSQFIEMFGENKEGTQYLTLKECCSKISGGKTPSMSHPEFYGGSIPFIKSGDVKASTVSKGALWLTEDAITKGGASLLPENTVIVVIRSAALQHEFHVAVTENPVVINQDIKAFQPLPEFLPIYLQWSILSHESALLSKVQTVLTSHIEMSDLLSLPVMVADVERQQAFCEIKQQSDKSKFELKKAIENTEELIRSLMQQDFSN